MRSTRVVERLHGELVLQVVRQREVEEGIHAVLALLRRDLGDGLALVAASAPATSLHAP